MATQAQIDNLTAAIASGTLRVRHGDKEKQYQSIDAMISARALLIQELAASNGALGNTTYGTFCRD